MSLSFFLASRLPLSYRKGKGRGGIAVAVTGIALSVIVMMLSISVMSGFRDEIRQKIIGFDSQITVFPRGDLGGAQSWVNQSSVEAVSAILPDKAEAELTLRQPAIMKTESDFSGIVIKGLTDHDRTFIEKNLSEGSVPKPGVDSTVYDVVISRILASRLGVDAGQKIDTYFMGDGVYRARRLKVAGIYDSHFSDYDKHVVYGSPQMLRRVVMMPDTCGAMIEINSLGNDAEIDSESRRLSDMLLARYYSNPEDAPLGVSNIHESAALYFNWLALLDTNVVVILSLMCLLSVLTLISSLFILILRRVNMIGILKAIGASNRLLRQTFILLTLRILALGLIAGNVIAIAIILIQRYTAIIPLEPDAYYLDHVPMALDWGVVCLLNLAVIVISCVVLLIPSGIIATISPSKAINYE
ncbi:MAG: ABC transporter permease [Muribaculaceae bacterium]|nr:ABC transporter permease [Muribaculaceae bacterium]